MIPLPFRRPKSNVTINALYGMIVAQARSPSFYRGYAVPDAVEPRIDMIMLHLLLVLRGLRRDGSVTGQTGSVDLKNRPLAQALFDHFCQDMDDNFREMGVGDLTVPKEMQRIVAAFYGRAKVYDAALDSGDMAALETTLARNIYNVADIHSGARRLAAYTREAANAIGTQNELQRGKVRFPDPDTVAPV